MYKNRFIDNDKYKTKIDSYRPLDENTLKQIKAYFKNQGYFWKWK